MKTKNILILGLLIAMSIAACKKDDDTTTPTETITRTDYVGSWSCTEVPIAKDFYFDCNISIDGVQGDTIKMKNFANLNNEIVIGIVSGKSIIIPKQVLINTVEGYGNMENKNFITWHYRVENNNDTTISNATFNRK